MESTYSLFDGFEAYRTPSEQDFNHVLKNGLVVLDANVLLDLYRMSARVRNDMLTVLEAVSMQLWVPHQVIAEFWRNRQGEELISYHTRKADSAKELIDDALTRAGRAIEDWAKSIHAASDGTITSPLREKLAVASEIFGEMKAIFDQRAALDSVAGIRDTNTDPVIQSLDLTLRGKVGAAYTLDKYADEIARAKERADKQIPPGYKDFEGGKKGIEEAAGDYLVWRQTLDEAQRRNVDVLFVTRDLKEDWWRRSSAKAVRMPRIELVNEMRDATNCRLLMVEPSALMKHVSSSYALGKKVDSSSVTALQHLESVEAAANALRNASGKTRFRLAQVPGGRTADYVETIWLMAQLVEDSPQLSSCVRRFMEEFPTVTLFPEARRRLMNLVSLGLALVHGDQIVLTQQGEEFVATRDSSLLSRLFVERIEGAAEARELIGAGVDLSELRELLVEHPSLELSVTQVELLVRWMTRLDLLEI